MLSSPSPLRGEGKGEGAAKWRKGVICE